MARVMPQVRGLVFELGEVPKHWHGGRPAVTAFLDNLSIFFPAGEAFFVASVRRFREVVKDDALREAVRAFCAQEGHHSREHTRYNRMLEEQGYPVEAMEGRVRGLVAWVKTRVPSRMQLAATCALEHFTATMAHALLGDARVLAGADETMAKLWRWHAAEEIEHKSVAYDVYDAAGGFWLERVAVMLAATLVFWAKVAEQQVRMMRADGIAGDWRQWRDLLEFLFVRPGTLTRIAPLYAAYFRPGFHPEDIASTEFLEEWEQQAGWAA